jgi:hypothetical protein
MKSVIGKRRVTHHNNNTFTWSGPSGVLDCTGERRVAPAVGWCMSSTHIGVTVVTLGDLFTVSPEVFRPITYPDTSIS